MPSIKNSSTVSEEQLMLVVENEFIKLSSLRLGHHHLPQLECHELILAMPERRLATSSSLIIYDWVLPKCQYVKVTAINGQNYKLPLCTSNAIEDTHDIFAWWLRHLFYTFFRAWINTLVFGRRFTGADARAKVERVFYLMKLEAQMPIRHSQQIDDRYTLMMPSAGSWYCELGCWLLLIAIR